MYLEVGHCYELSCFPPQIPMVKPLDGTFREFIKVKCSRKAGILIQWEQWPCRKRNRERSFTPPARTSMWGPAKRWLADYKPGRQLPSEPDLVGTLTPDLQLSELRDKFLLFNPPSLWHVCFSSLRRSRQTLGNENLFTGALTHPF